ncbi:hypothetical protein [Limosilactobacillus ingluviei]
MNKDNFIRVMLREQFGWDIAIKKPDAGTYVIVPRPDSAMATQIVHGLTGQSAEWTALTDRLRFLNRWATIRFNHVAFLVVNPQVPAKYLYFVKNGRDRYVVPRPEEAPVDLAACGDEMQRLVQSWATDWRDPAFVDCRSRNESTWEALPESPAVVDFADEFALLDDGRFADANDQLSGWLPNAENQILEEMMVDASSALRELGAEKLTPEEFAEAAGDPLPAMDEERLAELQAEVAKDLAYEAEHQDDDEWDHDDDDWDRDDGGDDWDAGDGWDDDYDHDWADHNEPGDFDDWGPADDFGFDRDDD